MIAFASSYHADQELVDFASHLADEAGKITRQYFRPAFKGSFTHSIHSIQMLIFLLQIL